MSEEIIVKIVNDCINSYIERIKDTRFLKKFRARARNIPSDYFMKGLAYTLVYIASRAGTIDPIEVGLRAKSCEELASNINRMKLGPEEAGYALYGALLAYTLKTTGILVAENFRKLLDKSMNNPLAERQTWIVLDWIKRLAEAYISE